MKVFTMSSKSMTQSKAKDPVEKQDKLEVMIKTLNGKMDKLSTKMMKIWMEELNCEVFNLWRSNFLKINLIDTWIIILIFI
jgi:hypothetical protein